MEKPLYQILASKICAMHNCVLQTNDEWYNRHKEAVEKLVKGYFPHGSGIDANHGSFLYDFCNDKKLVFKSEFHLNENGCYDGWYDFTITFSACLSCAFIIDIKTAKRLKNAGIDDYLCECYDYAMKQEVEECVS